MRTLIDINNTNHSFKIKIPQFSSTGVIGLFILSPLLALPYIFYKSYESNRLCQLLLSIFIGIICILAWPPRADLYRHYMTFYEIQNKSLDYILTYYLRFDVILLFFQYAGGKIGMSFEIVRLIFISFAYIMMLNLYNIAIKKNNICKTQKKILFIAILFSVPFIQISYALRYGLAITLISYVALKRCYLNEPSFSDYFFLILAIAIHFGSAWFIALVVVNKMIPNNVPKIIYILILIITIICSYLIADIIKILPLGFLGDHLIYMYTEGGASENHLIGRNFFGNIGEYINIATIILLTCIFLIKLKISENTKLAYVLLLFWFFTLPLFEINRRIGVAVVIYLGLTSIFSLVSQYKISKVITGWLVIGSLLTTMVNWRMYTISNIYYIVTPLPIILSQKYDKSWCNTNVDGAGDLKIYKR